MNYFWAVILQIVLIGLNAVFACAEIAIISMNEAKLAILSAKNEKGAKTAKKLSKLTADPAKFLSTIQVAITLAGFLGSAFAADMFAEPLVGFIMSLTPSLPYGVISTVCVVLITFILAFFNIVLGELVPKRIAMNHAEGVSTALVGVLGFVSAIFKPIVWLLTVSTNGILRLFGISPEDSGEEVTEEDILIMAETGTESGNIEHGENELIKNIFEFSDLAVGEICTHRKDVNILYLEDTDEEWQQLIFSTNHSYYPVCGDTVDDVRGVLYTKAYFRLADKSRESVMSSAVYPPMFTYENTPANRVFEKMKTTHEYFSAVTDEYGGMVGIVTIHDLLEALVGDMDDREEVAEYSIELTENGVWDIKGLAPLGKVEDAMDIKLPEEITETYETFGGYIFGQMPSLPEDGSEFSLSTDLFDITVLNVENRVITHVQVSLKQREEPDEE